MATCQLKREAHKLSNMLQSLDTRLVASFFDILTHFNFYEDFILS